MTLEEIGWNKEAYGCFKTFLQNLCFLCHNRDLFAVVRWIFTLGLVEYVYTKKQNPVSSPGSAHFFSSHLFCHLGYSLLMHLISYA